jgi:hypothetical protein
VSSRLKAAFAVLKALRFSLDVDSGVTLLYEDERNDTTVQSDNAAVWRYGAHNDSSNTHAELRLICLVMFTILSSRLDW